MRHLSFSRSTSKRWQRLTAFLTAIALIAGLLPLQAVTVMADPNDVSFEFEVINDDDNDYNSQIKLEYLNKSNEWVEPQYDSTAQKYTLPGGAADDEGNINLKFSFVKTDSNDKRVITGFSVKMNGVDYNAVVDDLLSGDFCELTIPYPTGATVTDCKIRVSLPNNLIFNQENKDNVPFYKFVLNRTLDSLTLPNNSRLEIYGANVSITGALTLGSNSELFIMDARDDNGQVTSVGTLSAGSIVPSENSMIMFESKANIPANMELYWFEGDELKAVTANEIPDEWGWFTFMYTNAGNNEYKWIYSDPFDPQSYGIFIDDTMLGDTTLQYTVQYRINGTDTWYPVEFPMDDSDPLKANINNGTVTIDANQKGLKELFFRLPDKENLNWEGEGYPKIDIKITIPDTAPDANGLKLISAALGVEEDGDNRVVFVDATGVKNNGVSVISNGTRTITYTIENIDEGPHEFHLAYDTGYYGIKLRVPFAENAGENACVLSSDKQSVVFSCFDGNKATVTNTSTIFYEIDRDMVTLWSTSPAFSFTATPAEKYTGYFYYDENGMMESSKLSSTAYTVTVDSTSSVYEAELNFEIGKLEFNGFTTISPEPPAYDDKDRDKVYDLESKAYTLTYEGGTVKVELIGDNSNWCGYKKTENDPIDGTRTTFKIETKDPVKLTFNATDGYIVNPEILGNQGSGSWKLNLDVDDGKACEIDLSTEFTFMNNPFISENQPTGGPDPTVVPQETPLFVFVDATGVDDSKLDSDGIIVVNFAHGSVTVTHDDDGSIFKINNSTNQKVIESDCTLHFALSSDTDYTATLLVDNVDGVYTVKSNKVSTDVTVEFKAPEFNLEMWGDYSLVEDASNNSFTLTYQNGSVDIADYDKCVGKEGNNFQFGGNTIKLTITPNTGFKLSKLKINDKDVDIVDGGILSKGTNSKWILTLNDLGKDNNVKVEVTFDPLPELKLTNYSEYKSGTLTFENGTVTVGNTQTNVFSDYAPIDSDITFNIAPADNFICYAYLNGNQPEYVSGTYTLKASELNGKNELYFKFEPRNNNSITIVEFSGTATVDGSNYKITYDHGSVLIPVASIDGEPVETDGITRFKVKSDVSNLAITLEPAAGYNAKLSCFGQNCELSNNTYTLLIDPNKEGPYNFEATFAQINLQQATVTYSYEGQAANIEIGENLLPYGQLTGKKVDFNVPLTPVNGKVKIKLSVNFINYMSKLVINNVDYSDQLPKDYKSLYESFGSQFTNIEVEVPVADSYTIYTKAYTAERGNLDQLAVGNFLWFYDYDISIANSGTGDDYVENATLNVLQVEIYDPVTEKWGEPITSPTPGSAIDWQPITKNVNGEEEVIGGSAVLPAGSKVTMQLIPDYGTQLVELGLGNPDEKSFETGDMYTYTFIVGPGNFHLNAKFEPVPNYMAPDSSVYIEDGSIELDQSEDSINGGSAVLFVNDTDLSPAEEAEFKTLADSTYVEITSYLDISLDQVVYQGVSKDNAVYSGPDKNVWDEPLEELSKPAEITLTVSDDIANEIGTGTVKVLHNHNGTLEVIDADYNPATKELTFKTSSFSDYAIAVEAEQYKVT
nr:hypothetical protein [Saccharofermentans sp.]